MKTNLHVPRPAMLFSMLMLLLFQVIAYASSPEGLWLTRDEETGKKRSIVRIEDVDGVLQVRIMQVYKKAGDIGICLKCSEPFKNKPVLDLVFAWGMKPTGADAWGGGHILDPKSGWIYRGKMTLQGENEMLVRGYIGISLLGRTQMWERVSAKGG